MVDKPCFTVAALPEPVYETIENPAVSFTLPELSILPIPVALASLVNAVPAFQHQATKVLLFSLTPLSSPTEKPLEPKAVKLLV